MHLCLFDIDGTLLNSGGSGGAAMIEALETEFGIDCGETNVPMAGRTDRAITEELFRTYGLAYESDPVLRFRERYFDLLANHLSGRDGVVLPGVPELLDRLAERDDVHLGLLTGNFERGAELKLGHFGLDHHFGFGGFGDVHRDRNRVAKVALSRAMAVLRANPPQTVWVIGDTPSDVRCGRAIAAKTVAVTTGHYERGDLEAESPDELFEDLADLDRFLSLLNNPNGSV